MSDCMHKGRLRNDLRKTSLHLRLSFDEKAAYSNKNNVKQKTANTGEGKHLISRAITLYLNV